MKKLAITACILAFTTGAHAYIVEGDSTDMEKLQTKGYSQELMKIMDTVKMHQQGSNGEYEAYYNKNLYSDHKVGKWYTVFKRYIDPVQDDNLFGRHQASFTNSWFEDSPSFMEKRKEDKAKDSDIYVEQQETVPSEVESL